MKTRSNGSDAPDPVIAALGGGIAARSARRQAAADAQATDPADADAAWDPGSDDE